MALQPSEGSQEIEIDEACEKFSMTNVHNAVRVKEFLEVIHAIIKAKQEIRNAPKSDVIYMWSENENKNKTTMKILLSLIALFSSLFAFVQSTQKAFSGFGAGLDYGGLGIRAAVH